MRDRTEHYTSLLNEKKEQGKMMVGIGQKQNKKMRVTKNDVEIGGHSQHHAHSCAGSLLF